LAGGLAIGPYVIFRALQAFTITQASITMLDSGSGGIGATLWEIHVLPAGALPAIPPVGVGDVSLAVSAAGSGVMNTAALTGLSRAVQLNGFIVVTIRNQPSTLGNYATISIRGT
jgi:hypothetical protein